MKGAASNSIYLFLMLAASTAIAQDINDGVLVESGQDTPNISTSDLQTILTEKSATVVDVRTYAEYAISHIPGVVNVTGKEGSTRGEFTSDADEIGRLVNNDKSAPIVIYCAGPYCGKAKRVAHDLVGKGYSNVSRYQLGIPVWRALGNVTEIELEGIQHVLSNDNTAVVVDTRTAASYAEYHLKNSSNIPAITVTDGADSAEIREAKEDGRLPMEDHNTRIIVVGDQWQDARKVAEALAGNAFHNVSYFRGPFAVVQRATAR